MGAAHKLWSTGSNSPSATCCQMASSTFSRKAKWMGRLLQNLGFAPSFSSMSASFQSSNPSSSLKTDGKSS